jgi:6,7-dimethyl-8-ribityllumazine synthase
VAGRRFAIVVSRFNPEVTQGLLQGARSVFADAGIPADAVTVVEVPGAFEIPLAAATLAMSGRFDAVVTLGCLIKGDTMHFEYIAAAASHGIMQASLSTHVPIAFGVLTTLDEAQAAVRSRPDGENKGREAAQAALDMAAILPDLRERLR